MLYRLSMSSQDEISINFLEIEPSPRPRQSNLSTKKTIFKISFAQLEESYQCKPLCYEGVSLIERSRGLALAHAFATACVALLAAVSASLIGCLAVEQYRYTSTKSHPYQALAHIHLESESCLDFGSYKASRDESNEPEN